jgi:hypothetical protein
MRPVRSGAALVVVGAILGVACGDDDETQSSTASSIAVVTSAASASTAPATTTPPTTTTPAPTTAATPTTATPTTSTTTTTVATVPAEWIEVDDLPAWAFPPCCADTWKAPGPSPALPSTGDPLEDGVYFADIAAWSPARPDTVTLAIHRFERCGAKAEDDSSECASWGPDAVYVEAGSVEREIALDDAFEVGMTGFECEDGDIGGQMFRGDGPSLARLWSALEADYDRWVRGPLETGVAAGDLAVQLDADPASPFERACPSDDFYLELVWPAADGPALLFQSLATLDPASDTPAPRGPEQLLLPAAFEIREGHPVLYLYEGFRS